MANDRIPKRVKEVVSLRSRMTKPFRHSGTSRKASDRIPKKIEILSLRSRMTKKRDPIATLQDDKKRDPIATLQDDKKRDPIAMLQDDKKRDPIAALKDDKTP